MKQNDNGKAFEYALGFVLTKKVSEFTTVEFVEDARHMTCKSAFESATLSEQERFTASAALPLATLFRLEPAICNPKGADDILYVALNSDAAGIAGDVRDVLLSRKNSRGRTIWEIGISAKNNHDAVKHSRLSPLIDFGKEWIGVPCSKAYMKKAAAIFGCVMKWKEGGVKTWDALGGDKEKCVYIPLLDAFKDELTRIFRAGNKTVAENLIMYLIGREPFYKVIKQDRNAMVVMKAFNFCKGLGERYNGVKPDCRPDKIPLPTRMVELAYSDKGEQRNSLTLIMDHGWQVDFRIHNASTSLENSLKFDIQLVGNPPVLFTQHVF